MFDKPTVSVPYKITLLSNHHRTVSPHPAVSVPYKITLLSNVLRQLDPDVTVSVPYKITLLSNHTVTHMYLSVSFSTL